MEKKLFYVELTNFEDEYTYEWYVIADSEDAVYNYFDGDEHVTRIELEYTDITDSILNKFNNHYTII